MGIRMINYKKIIKNRIVRIRLMQMLSFVPDRLMLKLQYRIKLGRKLNLRNPRRFTEKLQWYKLYYRDPRMRQCVDKYEVREYVCRCGMENILNRIYGVYFFPDEIDFERLPASFVLKDTLGGGGNSVILVPDKNKVNWQEACRQMREWIRQSPKKKHPGREWVYDGARHRILIEEYLESDPGEGGLIDFKFFCFDGRAAYLYVIADREIGGKAGFGIYEAESYKRIPAARLDERPLDRNIPKPPQYEQMLEIAEKLAKPFPEVRVDLYCVKGDIRFGEMTFFDGSGYMSFCPDEFDYMMGSRFSIRGM